MAGRSSTGGAPRTPLDRARIVAAAVELANEHGIAGVTMRAVARGLGVEAMSLYNHVSSRDDLLDGMVDAVFAEIALPPAQSGWREAMDQRAASARAVLLRHPWAVGLLDSRGTPGPATLRHHDAVLGALRAGGFSVAGAARAFSVIDSYLYGFVLQEVSLPFRNQAELDGVADDIIGGLDAEQYPHLLEVITEHALRPGYDYADEFDVGLSLILGALQPE